MLYLIQGPSGSGKSQLARDMKNAGQVDLIADVTAIWAAISASIRDARTGKYPIRDDNDPALAAARYLQTTLANFSMRQGLDVAVTTSQRSQVRRWQMLADDLGQELSVLTVDPGEEVVRERLADEDGTLSPECETAIGRWYE